MVNIFKNIDWATWIPIIIGYLTFKATKQSNQDNSVSQEFAIYKETAEKQYDDLKKDRDYWKHKANYWKVQYNNKNKEHK
ncbi:hypothetical protein [Apilactobacillus timberlakei]|uniref:hypothetical protein n=1 Tax=Apilactobacillus timberlakei TaxID=2008380 RepID=UPI00112B0BEE|nr:hypothetical protein [Apilactobacillus timberlakei]TPR12243.1 hypothetical protein DYZ97_07115 [Apilactobacillus timberlakei]